MTSGWFNSDHCKHHDRGTERPHVRPLVLLRPQKRHDPPRNCSQHWKRLHLVIAERSGFIPSKEDQQRVLPLSSPPTCPRKTRSTSTMNSAPRSFISGPSSSRRKARYALFPISEPFPFFFPPLPPPLREKPRLSSLPAHTQPRLCQGNGLYSAFLQKTGPDKSFSSGAFGCVRNHGYKVSRRVDLYPVKRDSRRPGRRHTYSAMERIVPPQRNLRI